MKRVLGLDLGSVTCGVAVSDELGMLAHGVETYRFPEGAYTKCAKHVRDLCKQYDTTKIVLGLPKHMNGDLGERAEITLAFKTKLEKLIPGCEVIMVDERLTTVFAENALIFADVSRKKRKQVIDKMAAREILQTYLDTEDK